MALDYIPREFNKMADIFSKEAAHMDTSNEKETFKIVYQSDKVINKVKINFGKYYWSSPFLIHLTIN